MRVPVAALALLLSVASASADRYEISSIHTSSQYATVNNAWTHNTPCVEVALRATEEIGTTTPYIKAYFFNKDREMVLESGRPSQVSFGDGQSVSVPAVFKPGKKSTIYFAIHPNVQRARTSGSTASWSSATRKPPQRWSFPKTTSSNSSSKRRA